MTKSERVSAGGLRLHHVAIRTADIDATVAFYERLLGLEVVRDQRPRSAWLGLADGAVLMIEARGAGEPPVPSGSLELFAFTVSPAEKAEIRARAREEGCFDGETEHSVYFRDPDGRRLGVSTFPLA